MNNLSIEIKKLNIKNLPPILEKDIDVLIQVINSGEKIFDCEIGEVLGDINQCESCKLISSPIATMLRDYYVNGGMFKNG